VTEAFITDLIEKGWQEIEHLQMQIANIEPTENSIEVIQHLKNLLTSYYVFVGSLESYKDTDVINTNNSVSNQAIEVNSTPTSAEIAQEQPCMSIDTLVQDLEQIDAEPFEYFVDFDEPVGEPLTDDDLYN
jgi:hypothetical protein